MLDPGDEDTTHEVALNLGREEGEVFSTPPQEIPHEQLTTQRDAGPEAAVIVATEVHGLGFPEYGEYRLQLVLDGQPVGERFIRVVRIPEEQAES